MYDGGGLCRYGMDARDPCTCSYAEKEPPSMCAAGRPSGCCSEGSVSTRRYEEACSARHLVKIRVYPERTKMRGKRR